MTSQISSQPKPNDAFKNDFQNARKRNLHIWMRWRSEVNDQLATSVFTGRHRVDVEPLDTYLHKTDHPSENPKTLLTYSASVDNISSLGIKRFLHYGIPRAKTVKKRPFSFGRLKSKDKSTSGKYAAEPLLESDEIENVDNTIQNGEASTSKITPTENHKQDTSFQDISDNSNVNVIPYYEPDPDYESSPGSPQSPGPGSSIDNITSPGTSFAGNNSSSSESEPEECPYVARQRQAEMFAANVVKRNIPTISRTYSTMNALDPTYVKSSEVKKNKTQSKKDKKKKNKDNDKDGSWKSFESSANSKSTDSKTKRSPLGNLFRKTSDAFTKLQSHSKNKSHYAKPSDVKLQKKESIYKNPIDVIPEDTVVNDSNNNFERIYSSNKNNTGTKIRMKGENLHGNTKPSRHEDIHSSHFGTIQQQHNTKPSRHEDMHSSHIGTIQQQHSRKETLYANHRDFGQSTDNAIYANHRDLKQRQSQSRERSEAVYDSHHPNNRSFQSFDQPPRFHDNDKVKMRTSQSSNRYKSRDMYKSEYARTSDIKRGSQMSSHFYGGSMDLYAAGLVEKVEFTQEPRRLGNYRSPDSKMYASHTVLNTKGFDNWGFN